MPQIKEYQSRTEQGGGVNFGSPPSGGAAVSRGIQQAGATIQDAADVMQRRAEQAETSDLSAKFAKLQADFTIDWNGRMQKGLQGATAGEAAGTTGSTDHPEGLGLAEQFVSDYDAAVAKLGDSISTPAGRRYFEQQNATLRKEFAVMADHGQAELAGAKTKANFMTVLNAQSSTLVQNPSSFEASLAMTDHTINTMVAQQHLPAKDAEALRVQARADLAQNSVRGWIRTNPAMAEEILNSGKMNAYLSGDAKHTLYGELRTELSARKADFAFQEDLKKKALKEAQDKAQNTILDKIYNGTFSIKDTLHGDGAILDPDKKQTMIAIAKARQNEPEHPDPNVFREIITRIHADESDPRKITTEDQLQRIYSRGGMTWEQYKAGRDELQGRKTTSGQLESEFKKNLYKEAEVVLAKPDPLTKLPSPSGQQRYNQFVADVEMKVAQLKKEGKDPTAVLNPRSKEYMGGDNLQRLSIADQQKELLSLMKKNNAAAKGLPPPAPEAYGPPNSAAPEEAMVPVVDANGNRFMLPKKNLEKAKARGYTEAK